MKASSSRKGELEARACAWTCPPHAVFDDLAQWRDSNPQLSRGVKDEGTRSGAADCSTIRTAKTSEEVARQTKQVILLRLRHTTRLRCQHGHEHEHTLQREPGLFIRSLSGAEPRCRTLCARLVGQGSGVLTCCSLLIGQQGEPGKALIQWRICDWERAVKR